jgi:2-dehydropantoate 2-reductase
MSSSILVIGQGAMGRFFAELLKGCGEVKTIPTRAFLQSYLETLGGSASSYSQIWVCSKAYSVREVCERLGTLASKSHVFITSNGLGVHDAARTALPGHLTLVRALCNFGIEIASDGRLVRHGPIKMTMSHSGAASELEDIAGKLRQLGADINIQPSPEAAEWHKSLINLAVNPICSLLGLRNGRLLEIDSLRELAKSVWQEARAVAKARGVDLSNIGDDQIFAAIAPHAGNENSMLADLKSGRPTEIGFLSGQIVAWGQQAGVPVPVNRTLWQLVLANSLSPR